MSKDTVRIGMMGLGTVGSSVVRVLCDNRENIERKAGARLEIAKVLVRDLSKPRKVDLPPGTLTRDPEDITGNPDIDVVVELMGGLSPARDYILTALGNAKPVVTANKEVMAGSGHEVFEAALSANTDIYFEASVGGAIPVIGPLKRSLAANRISEIVAIINGTCNYILTEMQQHGDTLEEVLGKAQHLGYAEPDPSDDILGHDTTRKIAILASIAFGTRVTPPQVHTEGITGVLQEDIIYGDELGWCLKLLGIARAEGNNLEVRVHPAFLPKSHPLSTVSGVYNAIWVVGDAAGEVMFQGLGAGGIPTSSSVLSDIIEAVQNLRRGSRGTGCTCYGATAVVPFEETSTRYYMRLVVEDRPGVLAQVAGAFAQECISFQSVIQKRSMGHTAEIVFVTHRAKERCIRRALEGTLDLPSVKHMGALIRVEA